MTDVKSRILYSEDAGKLKGETHLITRLFRDPNDQCIVSLFQTRLIDGADTTVSWQGTADKLLDLFDERYVSSPFIIVELGKDKSVRLSEDALASILHALHKIQAALSSAAK